MRRAALFCAAVAACGSGCFSGGSSSSGGAPPAALTLAPVAWNASNAPVGQVQAVAETSQTVAVFSSAGVVAFEAGAVASTDASVTAWRGAGAIPAADGSAAWLVGVTGDGRVVRVKPQGAAEDVSDRFGLAGAKVQAVSAGKAGGEGPPVGFLLDSGFAVSDGTTLTTYDGAELGIAAGGGKVALVTSGGVRLLDSIGRETDVALPDAAFVAYDDAGELVAATHHALYAIAGGAARLVYDAQARTIHQLVASGPGVWAAVDGDLALWRGGQVAVTLNQGISPDARMFGSPSGDVWIVAGGALQRFSPKTAASGDEAAWDASVQPIYAAVCSNCHSPTGSGKDSSSIDLSTYAAWDARKAKVYERVVTDAKTPLAMPPPTGAWPITDAQRAAIEAWAKP